MKTRMTQEEANRTVPCDERLEDIERTDFPGQRVGYPIRCTRPQGHAGDHADQMNGYPVEWPNEKRPA